MTIWTKEAAREFARRIGNHNPATDPPTPRAYTVTVRYRTNSGCSAKDVSVQAIDMTEAIGLASDKVRRMRGVVRIDGGECRE